MSTLIQFVKSEIVLAISFFLAVLSSFLIRPDALYFSYIDYRTLSILLTLMLIMSGFRYLEVFRQIGESLVARMNSSRGVVFVLVGLCFFSSMLITNDVSLITFVPFTVITLTIANRRDLMIHVIVLETIAANLGSMATPIGNPQNLYLYSLSGLSIIKFILLMLPYTGLAALLLIISVLLLVKKSVLKALPLTEINRTKKQKMLILIYLVCFAVSLLVVVRVLDYRIGLVLVLAAVLIFDRKRLYTADYSLIATFVFLFIFIGNMKRIPFINQTLSSLVTDREVLVSVLLSQIISNVPTAILCSGFTKNIAGLILGTNFGGLGTLIASMASLISFKQYNATENADSGKYILEFTFMNILFLAITLLCYYIF